MEFHQPAKFQSKLSLHMLNTRHENTYMRLAFYGHKLRVAEQTGYK